MNIPQQQLQWYDNSQQVELAVLLGANREVADREMKEALEFERQLANVRPYLRLNPDMCRATWR